MSDDQFSERELALLLDLTRLLKKHGPQAFKSLAASLADPEWSTRLSEILGAVAATAPQQSAARGSIRGRSASERVSAQLRNAAPARLALLTPMVDKLVAGEALPRLKDVTEFAMTVGLPAPRAKSRGDAIVDVVRALVAMPTDEFEKLFPEMEAWTGRGQRSLGGWSRIIERSRAETTGSEAH